MVGIPVITGGPEKNHEDRQAECAKRWTMGEDGNQDGAVGDEKGWKRNECAAYRATSHEAKHPGANTVRSADFKNTECV